MNWIKQELSRWARDFRRDWPIVVIAALVAWPMAKLATTLTAHAQEKRQGTEGTITTEGPAFMFHRTTCEDNTYVAIVGKDNHEKKVAVCVNGAYEQVVDLGPWIESHCVAVEREGRDIQHPANDDEKENLDYMVPPINIRPVHPKPWTEHIPEQTLRLKCSEEKAK